MMTTFFSTCSLIALGLFGVLLIAAIWGRSNELGRVAMWLGLASGGLGVLASMANLFGG
ncbi:MAG: hypothetical protein RLZZ129_650 [Verrucomicrobiota bacterium]|jgi:hypothetical protein